MPPETLVRAVVWPRRLTARLLGRLRALFRRVPLALSLSACFLTLPIAAQEESHVLEGRWSGYYSNRDGGHDVVVDIGPSEGTWRFIARGTDLRTDQCMNKALPLTIEFKSDSELRFSVHGNSVIQGCIDQSVALWSPRKRVLEGRLADGSRLSLSR